MNPQFLNFETQIFVLCANCSYCALSWQPDVQPHCGPVLCCRNSAHTIALLHTERCSFGCHSMQGVAVTSFLKKKIYKKKNKKAKIRN